MPLKRIDIDETALGELGLWGPNLDPASTVDYLVLDEENGRLYLRPKVSVKSIKIDLIIR